MAGNGTSRELLEFKISCGAAPPKNSRLRHSFPASGGHLVLFVTSQLQLHAWTPLLWSSAKESWVVLLRWTVGKEKPRTGFTERPTLYSTRLYPFELFLLEHKIYIIDTLVFRNVLVNNAFIYLYIQKLTLLEKLVNKKNPARSSCIKKISCNLRS